MHIGWDMVAYMGVRAARELEVVSHNLANASTMGFKRELLNNWRLRSLEFLGSERRPAYVDVLSRNFSQGALQTTENETDIALEGRGFFKVETPRGQRYTRNGCFRLTAERQLVTQEGYPVLGKNGPITLDAIDQKFLVDEQGGIHLDNSLSHQLMVVDFPNPRQRFSPTSRTTCRDWQRTCKRSMIASLLDRNTKTLPTIPWMWATSWA